MKPGHIIILITILILLAIGLFFTGKYIGEKQCPPQTIIRPHSTIIIDKPLIDSLQIACNSWRIKTNAYKAQIDSIQKLLNKKNETVIIFGDTCIPAILRDWASYQINEQ